MSVAYIGPKSRTERPRKTKIGTEVTHITCDTTFKVKRSRSQGTGHIVAASRTACYISVSLDFVNSGLVCCLASLLYIEPG